MSAAWDNKRRLQAERLFMDKQTVIVKPMQVYGRMLYYPANQTAKLFTEMVEQKALNEAQMKAIKALGFTIETAKLEIET